MTAPFQSPKQALQALFTALKVDGASDLPTLLQTFEIACATVSGEAIMQTCHEYIAGNVEGQSVKFAPRPPEFAERARAVDAQLRLLADRERRLSLPQPTPYRQYQQAPFESLREKATTRMLQQGRKMMADGVSMDTFKRGARDRTWPAGSVWVAALGQVWSPMTIQPKERDNAPSEAALRKQEHLREMRERYPSSFTSLGSVETESDRDTLIDAIFERGNQIKQEI